MDMIQAMNTGHDGSMSTGHANSIEGMLKRLEAMFMQAADFPVEAIRNQITEGIDIMVHMCRMRDGSRKVTEIAEIAGMEGGNITMNPLFRQGRSCRRQQTHPSGEDDPGGIWRRIFRVNREV